MIRILIFLKKSINLPIVFGVMLFVLVYSAKAQVFEGEQASDTLFDTSEQKNASQVTSNPQEEFFMPEEQEDQTQKMRRPAPRATVKFKPVSDESSLSSPKDEEEEPQILLYMRNFEVTQTLSGTLTCSMSFYVQSTFPEKISNISYRLKWPDMETPLSFDNVEPFQPFYQNYALLGKGCYNMDQIPNIIVNRCRIKGIPQQTCANAIHWVK